MPATHPFDLSGQVALITGSSRGIGKSIALVMADAGAKVVVCSRKLDACQAVVDEIAARGGTAIAVACNISDKEQVESLVKEAEARLGKVTTLVCNAAVNPAYGPMAALEDRAFDKIMQVNVGASIRLINLVAPGMAAKGEGSIILLSSIAGLMGSKTIGAYAISKTADIQVARNYAVELGPQNIRVNALVPGLIHTDFSTVLWEGKRGENFIARTPLGRLGTPEDIAGVALFLASKASRYVTGQAIVADGGTSISDPF
jgi:NAD(P)-dependent dehydrogenase (short-subunit alcohol dehydrogenase family)